MIPEQSQNNQEPKIDQQVSQTPETQNQEPSPPIKSEENQANWKAYREQRASERKAREDAERRANDKAAEAEALKAALEAITNKPSRNEPQYSRDDDIEESEEERIDKRVEEILKKREHAAHQSRLQQEQKELPQKLQRTYGDFEKVCTSENLDYLEYHYPEVATPFKHVPEGFEKWSGIYKAVKRFVPNLDSKADVNKIDRNLSKPGSISSPTNTQGNSMPNHRLDEAKKAANWQRMQNLLKGLS